VKDQPSEDDVDQGNEKVAEAAFKHVPGVHGPDVDEPVDGEQQAAEQIEPESAWRRKRTDNLAQPAPRQHDGGNKNQRPDHAVCDQFMGINPLQLFPVERDQPPERVAGKGGQGTAASIGMGGHGGQGESVRDRGESRQRTRGRCRRNRCCAWGSAPGGAADVLETLAEFLERHAAGLNAIRRRAGEE
jgi:hypothetical protein